MAPTASLGIGPNERSREPLGFDQMLSGQPIVVVLLRASGLLRGRQLQHGHVLPFDQPRDENDLAARQLERVVMDVRLVHVDLPEACHSYAGSCLAAPSSKEAAAALELDVVVERNLR